MPEPRHHEARGVRLVAVCFRNETSVEEVVARLLEAVRRTDLFLLKVYGDGNRLYPFAGRNPAQTASSWRAELSWNSPPPSIWRSSWRVPSSSWTWPAGFGWSREGFDGLCEKRSSGDALPALAGR